MFVFIAKLLLSHDIEDGIISARLIIVAVAL
jgi:hypothetical protein